MPECVTFEIETTDKPNFGGVVALTIHPDHLIITRKPDVDWVVLIDEICDAIRDFYL